MGQMPCEGLWDGRQSTEITRGRSGYINELKDVVHRSRFVRTVLRLEIDCRHSDDLRLSGWWSGNHIDIVRGLFAGA